MEGFLHERLPFKLPDFSRHCWADPLSEQVWHPRFLRISQAFQNLEWLSVLEGVRACALLTRSQGELLRDSAQWIRGGISVVPLQFEQPTRHGYTSNSNPSAPGLVPHLRVALGSREPLLELLEGWERQDQEVIGHLLGYPKCCRDFFSEYWVDRRCVDTTWAMSANTAGALTNPRNAEPEGFPTNNVFFRYFGVRACPHLPCSFDCQPSNQLAEKMLALGDAAGFDQEMDWLRTILEWPLVWSSLHGIAELKTPVLRLITRTDATASKHVVRWRSLTPEAPGNDLLFPSHQKPERASNDSDGARRGISVVATASLPSESDWQFRDNGFPSLEQMNECHQPILHLARSVMGEGNRNVLDIGCGNGMLLHRLINEGTNAVPYGIDNNPGVIEHARQVFVEHGGNFRIGNMFDQRTWDGLPHFGVAIVMAGRLLEVSAREREEMIHWLGSNCDKVIAYVYPGWGRLSLEEIIGQLHLGIIARRGGIAALISQWKGDERAKLRTLSI